MANGYTTDGGCLLFTALDELWVQRASVIYACCVTIIGLKVINQVSTVRLFAQQNSLSGLILIYCDT